MDRDFCNAVLEELRSAWQKLVGCPVRIGGNEARIKDVEASDDLRRLIWIAGSTLHRLPLQVVFYVYP